MSWGHQFLTEVKKNLDFGIFQLGLSNFWIGAWFPFDVLRLNEQDSHRVSKYSRFSKPCKKPLIQVFLIFFPLGFIASIQSLFQSLDFYHNIYINKDELIIHCAASAAAARWGI